MDSPETHVHDRLSSALARAASLERALVTQEAPKGCERLLTDVRRLARDLERGLVQSQDAVSGRESLRALAEAANRRASLLFRLSPTPCLVVDRAGTIVDANPAGARMVNTSVRHLVGRALPMFVSANREQLLARLAMIDGGDEPSCWPVTIRPRERGARQVVLSVVADVSDQLLVMMLQPGEAIEAEAGHLDDGASRSDSPVAFGH